MLNRADAPGSLVATPRYISVAFVVACLLLLALELAGAMGLSVAPHHLLSLNPNRYSPFLSYAVGGIFVTQLVMYGRDAAVLAAAVNGLLILILHCALLQPAWNELTPWLGLFCYCLGLGSLLLLIQQILCRRISPNQFGYAFALQAGLLPALFVALSWSLLENYARLPVLTLDGPLWHFENSLGILVSSASARLFLNYPLLADICNFVYCSLPLAVALVFAQQVRLQTPSTILKHFLLAGLIGSCLYIAYPAAGPRYLFGSAFPWQIPGIASIPSAPRRIEPAFLNAMPSLHMAWALLLWFSLSEYTMPIRLVAAAFLALTVLATLGLGEHYLVDLVVACPLAVLVYRLVSPDHSPAGYILPVLLVAGWLIYLRTNNANFATVGLWHWLPVIATVVFCLRSEAIHPRTKPG